VSKGGIMVKKTVMSGMRKSIGQKREKIIDTENTSGNDNRKNSTMVV
jgi:hypothetical protein